MLWNTNKCHFSKKKNSNTLTQCNENAFSKNIRAVSILKRFFSDFSIFGCHFSYAKISLD